MSSDRVLKVLCLHGHPGNSEAMQMFVRHFQDRGIDAIAPDLRGYGNCKAILPFTMLDHIQDLWDLLLCDHQSEYLILGWSLGGILAIELALRALSVGSAYESPNQDKPKIAGLILIATAAKPRSSLPKIAWWEYSNLLMAVGLHCVTSKIFQIFFKDLSNSSLHPFFFNFLMRLRYLPMNLFGKRSLIGYLIQQHSITAYDRISTMGARAYLQTSRYAQAALNQALRQGYDRTGDLKQIQVPCLVIAGEQDRHITAAATAETADLLPNCEFICYPHTAHLLPWEIGDRLLSDIEAWCDRHLY
ncbi:alpha/beta hydrolase [Pseudanabaena sp. FACHB-1998]|uniref:alpha/beta fold hydrolase n=1 Tax=Pseudanabaena sp. FACHB-1998 TaxID=2692858 RepID=UPI0016817B6C|nr:alpha/beta hydrolase [Pseudanabaena sp. FACHB-1998]MBD2178141.1 alpha/beta hydrolase [Pseudanabaena sp. FACHB-1998]